MDIHTGDGAARTGQQPRQANPRTNCRRTPPPAIRTSVLTLLRPCRAQISHPGVASTVAKNYAHADRTSAAPQLNVDSEAAS